MNKFTFEWVTFEDDITAPNVVTTALQKKIQCMNITNG